MVSASRWSGDSLLDHDRPAWQQTRRNAKHPTLPRVSLSSTPAVAITGFLLSSPRTPELDLYWYIEHVSAITAIPLAVVGFGFTLWQVRKTRTAAEAAQRAAERAQRGIGRSTLLLLIPQLQRAEEELDRAVETGQQNLVLLWLATWRWQAGQLRGLLKVAAPDERTILRSIQESIVATVDLKNSLLGIPGSDLIAATKEAREAIAAVTNGLGELAVVQGIQMGRAGDV
jgi:hypothetical protein